MKTRPHPLAGRLTDLPSVHGESASTALVVAAYYRFRKLAPWLTTDEMNQACDRAFDGVMAKVDDNGWMTQVSSLSPRAEDNLSGTPC